MLIDDFIKVAALAGGNLSLQDFTLDFLEAPHKQPRNLPPGKMAVYIFFLGNQCLKVGKVGSHSTARYTSQHYNPKSSSSNLAKSILRQKTLLKLLDIDELSVGDWIRTSTKRINILLPDTVGMPVLGLLESFLQCRLNPLFEGFESQNNRLAGESAKLNPQIEQRFTEGYSDELME